jgi:cardiolipin synthase
MLAAAQPLNRGVFLTKVPLNIPNVITFFRFLLIPPAVVYVFLEQYIIALILFGVACFTDLLDGYIARKYNMISEAGILLDPLADKVMAVCMVIALTIQHVYPLFVAIIIFLKEGCMIGGGIFLYTKKIVEPSNIIGKAAALVFNIALGLALLYQYIGLWYLYVMYFALALTVIAFLQYAYLNAYRKLKAKRQKQ